MSTLRVTAEVLTVHEHPNADALELAQVGLYRAVVAKGAFRSGEVALYIPEQAVLPDELIEAARIDGASELNIFMNISMRLMTPALVTILLFQFVAVWNNYFLPLVMLSNERLFPITLGLQTWNVTTGGSNKFLYTQIVTGALISSIPLIIGCVVLQRFWKGGLGAGSVKS